MTNVHSAKRQLFFCYLIAFFFLNLELHFSPILPLCVFHTHTHLFFFFFKKSVNRGRIIISRDTYSICFLYYTICKYWCLLHVFSLFFYKPSDDIIACFFKKKINLWMHLWATHWPEMKTLMVLSLHTFLAKGDSLGYGLKPLNLSWSLCPVLIQIPP